MATDRKKTQAELLEELESLKGLLSDPDKMLQHHAELLSRSVADEAIPILLEEDTGEDLSDIPTLVNTHDSATENPEAIPAEEPPLLTEASEASTDASSQPDATADEKPPAQTAEEKTPAEPALTDAEPITAEGVLPGQQSLFAEPDHSSQGSNKPVSPEKAPAKTVDELRAGLKKPLGENPFLPQHIRERLHGANLPAELRAYTEQLENAQANPAKAAEAGAETGAGTYSEAHSTKVEHKRNTDPTAAITAADSAPPHKTEQNLSQETPSSTPNLDALIDQLVQDALPKIEARLRKQLRQKLAAASKNKKKNKTANKNKPGAKHKSKKTDKS